MLRYKTRFLRLSKRTNNKLFKVQYDGPLTFENFSNKSIEEKKTAKSKLEYLISKKDNKTI